MIRQLLLYSKAASHSQCDRERRCYVLSGCGLHSFRSLARRKSIRSRAAAYRASRPLSRRSSSESEGDSHDSSTISLKSRLKHPPSYPKPLLFRFSGVYLWSYRKDASFLRCSSSRISRCLWAASMSAFIPLAFWRASYRSRDFMMRWTMVPALTSSNSWWPISR